MQARSVRQTVLPQIRKDTERPDPAQNCDVRVDDRALHRLTGGDGNDAAKLLPVTDKPYFRADVFYPDGYGVNDVAREMKKVEAHLQKLPEVKKYRSPSEALRCVTTWRLPP